MEFELSKTTLQNLIDKNFDEIVVLKETQSTSDLCKDLALKGTSSAIVVSESQTKGRGRLNREFYSPKNKGVYLSLLLRPNLKMGDAFKITSFCGVATANAIESLANVKVGLKWVNDLFINSKKVGGILTESAINAETRTLDYVIIGIGVNVYNDNYPDFIKNVATNIEKESNKKIDKNELIAKIVNNLNELESAVISGNYLKEYTNRQVILNKQVKVVLLNEEFYATAVGIDENGALIVNKNGELKTITAGDVSIRF
ncbi:MAG: biotin--[Clostridia bacterium]|nr:biotin--[acetyl-CoA-carboxylase] ligase [Clostridia bacterium]